MSDEWVAFYLCRLRGASVIESSVGTSRSIFLSLFQPAGTENPRHHLIVPSDLFTHVFGCAGPGGGGTDLDHHSIESTASAL